MNPPAMPPAAGPSSASSSSDPPLFLMKFTGKTKADKIARDAARLCEAEGISLEQLHANIADEVSRVEQYFSPHSIRHRQELQELWCGYLTLFAGEDAAQHWWYSTHYNAHSENFLAFRVKTTRGRYTDNVVSSTLGGWFNCLLFLIASTAHDPVSKLRVGDKLLTDGGLYQRLKNCVHSLVLTHKLPRHRLEVDHWGLPQASLLIQEALQNTTNNHRLHAIGNCTLISLALFTGLRPGSFAPSCDLYLRHGRYMKLRDLKFTRISKGRFRVVLTVLNFKGEFDSLKPSTQKVCLMPVNKAHNLIFEPQLWLILWLFLRGAFDPKLTVQDIMEDDHTHLLVREQCLDWPLFCAYAMGDHGLTNDSPTLTSRIYHTIKALGDNAGLWSGRGLYDFRRGALNDIASKLGDQVASLLAKHADAGTTFSKYYSQRMLVYNLVMLRCGELDHVLPDLAKLKANMSEMHEDSAVIAMLGRAALNDAVMPGQPFEGVPALQVNVKTRYGVLSHGKVALTSEQKEALGDEVEDKVFEAVEDAYAAYRALVVNPPKKLPPTIDPKGRKPPFAQIKCEYNVAEGEVKEAREKLDAAYKARESAKRKVVKNHLKPKTREARQQLRAHLMESETVSERDKARQDLDRVKNPSTLLAAAVEHHQRTIGPAMTSEASTSEAATSKASTSNASTSEAALPPVYEELDPEVAAQCAQDFSKSLPLSISIDLAGFTKTVQNGAPSEPHSGDQPPPQVSDWIEKDFSHGADVDLFDDQTEADVFTENGLDIGVNSLRLKLMLHIGSPVLAYQADRARFFLTVWPGSWAHSEWAQVINAVRPNSEDDKHFKCKHCNPEDLFETQRDLVDHLLSLKCKNGWTNRIHLAEFLDTLHKDTRPHRRRAHAEWQLRLETAQSLDNGILDPSASTTTGSFSTSAAPSATSAPQKGKRKHSATQADASGSKPVKRAHQKV
ncbi:uncharacterized protein BXZ73DRAFT_107249 [Epithele typhae]|uniref:uncharacterized protein n=1 Tax=Epithele typhae TaxID=378194 RepID=UPI0020086AB9|nr:uncharacterized protein BXZ73DRAFT_107249 [Epithele typhae]KAH9912730.1 hypothetical protein BXZ73DRAFT_107249 [Epithele typhae]